MMPHVQQRTQWHIERFTVGAEMNPTIAHAMWNRHRLHVVCVTLKIIMQVLAADRIVWFGYEEAPGFKALSCRNVKPAQTVHASNASSDCVHYRVLDRGRFSSPF